MTDYQKQLVTKHLKQQDPTIFDGENFVAGVPFPQISTYYTSYLDGLNQATNNWNKNIPSSGKNTPDGQELFKQLKSAQQWGQAMQTKMGPLEKQYQAQQQANQQSQRQAKQQRQAQGAAHKQVCREFLDTAMLPQTPRPDDASYPATTPWQSSDRRCRTGASTINRWPSRSYRFATALLIKPWYLRRVITRSVARRRTPKTGVRLQRVPIS